MNADVEKAVEAADQACATYRLGFAGRRHWQTIRQALRDQEAQIARLREDCASQQRIAIAEQVRAEKAEALLREAYRSGYGFDIHERIRTFLGLSEND